MDTLAYIGEEIQRGRSSLPLYGNGIDLHPQRLPLPVQDPEGIYSGYILTRKSPHVAIHDHVPVLRVYVGNEHLPQKLFARIAEYISSF